FRPNGVQASLHVPRRALVSLAAFSHHRRPPGAPRRLEALAAVVLRLFGPPVLAACSALASGQRGWARFLFAVGLSRCAFFFFFFFFFLFFFFFFLCCCWNRFVFWQIAF